MFKRLLFVVAFFFVSSAFAQDVGRLNYAEGRVDITKAGAQDATAAKEGALVSVGDFIRTKSDSKAEVVFLDNSVLRLAQNSRVQIQEYQLDSDSKRKTATIMLERGKVRTIVAKSPGAAPFIISTPNASGVVKGSDIFAFYQAGNSGMLVAEGQLSVMNLAHPDKNILIPAGNSVLIPLQELPLGPRPFMDVEKKMEEAETNIPFAFGKGAKAGEMSATLTSFSGEVKITSKGSANSHAAKLNEKIEEGYRIQTGKDAKAEIVFTNGNAMYLKANSDITIIQLIIDAKTQEYENIFDAKVGKIKARIERLNGKSKFEVRTPAAVCGARGTIMYLGVTPEKTDSFFEGGMGYATQTSTGVTKFLDPGEQLSIDASGSMGEPTFASDSDRMSFDEGFEAGNGTDDQSSLEGSAGGYLYDSDTDANTAGDSADGANSPAENDVFLANEETGITDTFVDVPITDAGTVEDDSSGSTTPAKQVGDLFSSELIEGSPVLRSNGSLYDLTPSADWASIWGGSALALTMTGSYILDDASTYHIWTCEDSNFFSYDSATGTYTLPSGGAFYGLAGGILGNINGTDTAEGLFIALTIAPDKYAGTISGFYSGSNTANFTLTGTTQYSSRPGTYPFDLLPEDLYYKINNDGSFTGNGLRNFPGGGFIKTYVEDGTVLNIDSPTGMGDGWGIWGARIAGSYSTATGSFITPFNLQVSGKTTDTASGEADGAWLGLFKTTTWSGNKISGTMDGIRIGLDKSTGNLEGTNISGNHMGAYIDVPVGDTGTWQSVGCGKFNDLVTPLANPINPVTLAALQSLDSSIIGMNGNISTLEVRDQTATGPMGGSGTIGTVGPGTINANMYMSLYNADAAQLNGIWAALISGTFTAPTVASDSWSIPTVNDPYGHSATFTGTKWSDNQWRADVTGSTSTAGGAAINSTFNGTAAGTYSGSTFQGTGAGNWTSP